MDSDSTYIVILKYLAINGGIGNVMEALNFDSARFEEGFAIALQMDNQNLVKLLYSNFNKNMIVVEMTRVGHHALNK